MSDCSTEAMKPKEPPMSSTGIDVEDLQKCVELIASVTGAPVPDCPCNLTDVYHSVKDLQQRHQQLEQVAWEMFQDIESAFVSGKFKPEVYADYRDKLEAVGVKTYGLNTDDELGVSIDD